jgi:hypothetical protein
MLADHAPVLADLDPLRIGPDLHRAPDRARRHRVAVVVEAHEAGLRDRRWYEGAQSALAEIEKISGEDLADQLKETPASLKALAKAAAPVARRRTATKKAKVQQRKAKPNGAAPKAVTVQRCIQSLIASRGEARRDEILAAARADNPKITSQDVHNGIRTLTRRAEIRVDPKETSRLLASEARSEQPSAS